jgi:hypothetical protein
MPKGANLRRKKPAEWRTDLWEVLTVDVKAPGFGEGAWLRLGSGFHHKPGESYEQAAKRIAGQLEEKVENIRLTPVAWGEK